MWCVSNEPRETSLAGQQQATWVPHACEERVRRHARSSGKPAFGTLSISSIVHIHLVLTNSLHSRTQGSHYFPRRRSTQILLPTPLSNTLINLSVATPQQWLPQAPTSSPPSSSSSLQSAATSICKLLPPSSLPNNRHSQSSKPN